MSELDITLKQQTENVSMIEMLQESEIIGGQLNRNSITKYGEKEMEGEF